MRAARVEGRSEALEADRGAEAEADDEEAVGPRLSPRGSGPGVVGSSGVRQFERARATDLRTSHAARAWSASWVATQSGLQTRVSRGADIDTTALALALGDRPRRGHGPPRTARLTGTAAQYSVRSRCGFDSRPIHAE